MKNFINAAIILMTITGCSAQSTFVRFSNKMTPDNYALTLKKGNLFKEARKKVYDATLFLREKNITDTIFLLETYDLETATVYGRIWTKRNNISYSYRRVKKGNGLLLADQKAFSTNEILLVEKWDTVALKKVKTQPYITTNNIITAARYFTQNGNENFYRIYFGDFFDPSEKNR